MSLLMNPIDVPSPGESSIQKLQDKIIWLPRVNLDHSLDLFSWLGLRSWENDWDQHYRLPLSTCLKSCYYNNSSPQ